MLWFLHMWVQVHSQPQTNLGKIWSFLWTSATLGRWPPAFSAPKCQFLLSGHCATSCLHHSKGLNIELCGFLPINHSSLWFNIKDTFPMSRQNPSALCCQEKSWYLVYSNALKATHCPDVSSSLSWEVAWNSTLRCLNLKCLLREYACQ